MCELINTLLQVSRGKLAKGTVTSRRPFSYLASSMKRLKRDMRRGSTRMMTYLDAERRRRAFAKEQERPREQERRHEQQMQYMFMSS